MDDYISRLSDPRHFKLLFAASSGNVQKIMGRMPSAAELEKLKKCPFGKRNQMRLQGREAGKFGKRNQFVIVAVNAALAKNRLGEAILEF